MIVILTNLARCSLEGSPLIMRLFVRLTMLETSERQQFYIIIVSRFIIAEITRMFRKHKNDTSCIDRFGLLQYLCNSFHSLLPGANDPVMLNQIGIIKRGKNEKDNFNSQFTICYIAGCSRAAFYELAGYFIRWRECMFRL